MLRVPSMVNKVVIWRGGSTVMGSNGGFNTSVVCFCLDLGLSGLWGVLSHVSWIPRTAGLTFDRHQPEPALLLWTGHLRTAFGAWDWFGNWRCDNFRPSARLRFRQRRRIKFAFRFDLKPKKNRVGIQFRVAYRCWRRASGCNGTIWPGFGNTKEVVSPRVTSTSGLTDSAETQLGPGGELRKKRRVRRMGRFDSEREGGRILLALFQTLQPKPSCEP